MRLQKWKSVAGILVLSISWAQEIHGLVRITQRPDYTQIGRFDPVRRPLDVAKITNPVLDRINGVRDVVSGQHLGGDWDLVYQDIEDQLHVYRCPSLRPCLQQTKLATESQDLESPLAALVEVRVNKTEHGFSLAEKIEKKPQVNACIKIPEYWKCQELVVNTREKLCARYTASYRYVLAKNWLLTEILGGLVEAPITWLTYGIQAQINDATDVADFLSTNYQLATASCNSASFGRVFVPVQQTDLQRAIFVMQEDSKEDLSMALSSLSKNLDMRMKHDLSDDQKMRSGGHKRSGFLNILKINSEGQVPFEDQGPVSP